MTASASRPLAVRSAGILLHPTSLPGRFGIGEIGREAHRWLDRFAGMGQRLWQVLPPLEAAPARKAVPGIGRRPLWSGFFLASGRSLSESSRLAASW